MGKLYKNFIFDIVLALVFLALGIVMLPPFNIGKHVLNILLALVLLAYLVIFLYDKAKRAKGSIFILTVVEFVVISLIVVGLLLQQLRVFSISGICRTLGLVIWLRGSVSAIAMYLAAFQSKRDKKNLPAFLLAVLMISFGVFLFAKPIISDVIINWILCILFFLCFLICGALALLFAPEKKKK